MTTINEEKRLKNAEKQRRFRQNRLKDECDRMRLQCNLETGKKKNLERLARYYGYTETKMLEILIEEKTDALVKTLSASEMNKFYDT